MELENNFERIDYPASASCEVPTCSSEACIAGQGQRQDAGQEGTPPWIILFVLPVLCLGCKLCKVLAL